MIFALSVLVSVTVAVYSATVPPTPYWVSCQFKANGLLEVGCWGYVECRNGVPYTTYCTKGQVYNVDTGKCIATDDKHHKCDEKSPCPSMYDHRYPDQFSGCESYYFCMAGSYFQRYYCPKGTVFNEGLQTCDYPGDTPPPCGTYTYTRTTYAPGPGR